MIKGQGSKVKGFTLIEVLVTISIIAIIAVVTSGIIISVMQLFVYVPNEMNGRTVAQEALHMMIEGEAGKWGMRDAVKVIDASSVQFTYMLGYPTDVEKRVMKFRWDGATKKIYRSYTAFNPQEPYTFSNEELVPYYSIGVSIEGRPGSADKIFTYYKEDGSEWKPESDTLTQIRRVKIAIAVKTGSGLFSSWGSSFTTTSEVSIKQYL